MQIQSNGKGWSARVGGRFLRAAMVTGLLVAFEAGAASPLPAAIPGMVMDYRTGRAVLFDAETGLVTGSVALGPSYQGTGDCLVLGDRGPAFSTDFNSRVWAIDLEAAPAAPAPAPNPIRISNPGEDLALSPDGRYLVVCDGSGVAPVSVIDIASRREVATFDLGSDCNAVDVCDDGSVLVSSIQRRLIRRLVLSAAGTLSDTSESVAADLPINVDCSPGSRSGVVLSFSPGSVQSFTIPGLTAVDTRSLAADAVGSAQSILVHPSGDRVYIRGGLGVAAFAYDPLTGQLGSTPDFTFPAGSMGGFYGMDQIAIDPAGERLYVTQAFWPGPAVRIHSAANGDLLGEIIHPEIVQPTGVCLSLVTDQDDDGLSDAREAELGTDPANPDSDGDGLLDGFEVRFGLDPRAGGNAVQDPDGDGLDNLAEQAARTDPTVADTDGDGLADGQELQAYVTDPRNPDTDGDRLQDGAEVAPHGSDPRDPDSDDGGVPDGVEVTRDGTRPTDATDDRPAGRAMVMDSVRGQAVVFDRDSGSVVGKVDEIWGQAVGDCVLPEDGLVGFASSFSWEIHAIDLGATPPARTPPPNPIAIDNPGEDVALTPDGRFILACDGSSVAPVVVVDAATRTQVDALHLGTDCTSVDVCVDGTVLVTSWSHGFVRRLEIDGAGRLSDTGLRLAAEAATNVACAPDGRSAVVLSASPSSAVTSFTLPAMELVDRRVVPASPVAAAFGPTGDRLYVRHASTDTGGVQAFGFDPAGHLSAAPLFAFPVAPARRFFGIDTLAVDPSGTELYVSETGAVTVFDPADGRAIASIQDAAIENPTGVCLRHPDRDHDGLTDDRERRLGSDPEDPDSDDDGLLDGFEIRHDFDPLSPHDGPADGDADGLDNRGEQAARTDPANPDTDGDGLSDGEEVLTFATDPRDGDGDDDGLTDPQEVRVHATDPRDPDTDGGGILDGNEIDRDGTDPLDPADDLPAARAMVLGYGESAIVAFDQETRNVLARLRPAGVNDEYECVIPPGGEAGFATNLSRRLAVVDLASSPPVLGGPVDGIPISNSGSSLAASPDGRFLVACGGSGGVSLVDLTTRAEVDVAAAPNNCRAIDVCPDGSVLVATGDRLHRLAIDPAGTLSDTGEQVTIPPPASSQWTNVYCSPGGGHAIAFRSDRTVRSFSLHGLEPVDTLDLSDGPISAAFRRTGEEATMFLLHGSTLVYVSAYNLDLSSGRFGDQPLFTREVPSQPNFGAGFHGFAIDRTGERLYVAWDLDLSVHSTHDGSLLDPIRANIASAWSVCTAPAGDVDHDGLADDEERRLGIDARNADTDGDGLLDRFEVRNGLDARAPGDRDDDPDADGLDNLAEQGAGTRPRNPDTDADGLGDGQEVLVFRTDPLDADTDDDGLLDGADGCPRDVRNDADGDGVCGGIDLCPATPDPMQQDVDGDGLGDLCDACPRFADQDPAERVACFAPITGSGACLETMIDVVGGAAADGALLLFTGEAVPPEAIRFTLFDTACSTGDRFEFALNGMPLGGVEADPGLSCGCAGTLETFRYEDAAALASVWRSGRDNSFAIRKVGFSSAIAWIRLSALRGGAATTSCLFDQGGGGCDATDLCEAGYLVEPFTETRILFDPFVGGGVPLREVPFSGAGLPASIDLAGIAAGDYLLCVRNEGSLPAGIACVPIPLDGAERLVMDGSGCGSGPTAAIAPGGAVECESPDGAVVLLDGSGSSDPDGDLTLFEWFEDYGAASERLLTTGRTASVTLTLGAHAITLRVVDAAGRAATAGASFSVVDTTPPELTVGVSPALLWPPAHQMVPVAATVAALDRCGSSAVTLLAVTSSEPDDAPGGHDGQTTQDIQGADAGAADLAFSLRAERSGTGGGRTYTVAYRAIDASGNPVTATSPVAVPRDRHGRTDPIELLVGLEAQAGGAPGTHIVWTDAAGLPSYDVVRGHVDRIREHPDRIDLGPLDCVERGSIDRSTAGYEDAEIPPIGQAFFYLVEYDDGVVQTYGSDGALKPRVAAEPGGCD